MRLREITEGVGRITKQNQTHDVGPDEVTKQAAKFGNKVDKDGRPPTLSKKVKGSSTNVLFNLGLSEGYNLQLERDKELLVLNITDTATGKRTEVRGKPGYETDGYDPTDKLHQLLDKVGRSASVSDMMNGDVVTINPKHPKGASAKTATDTAFNEALDNPYPFNLSGPTDSQGFVATAQTPNGVLRMDFETTDYDNFGIDFAVGKSMGKTEAGDEFRVFATVVAMMNKWISTVGIEHVESFDFGANKGEHASDGRAKLYTRFAKKLAARLGWKLDQSTTRNQDTAFFKLTNPKPVPREQEYWDAIEENFADGKAYSENKLLDKPTPSIKQLSKKHNVDKEDIISQVKKGVKVELEHTSDPKIALEIALDHINELPDYYDRLETVEENFADGKKKGKSRPGRVKKSGASCNGTVTQLRKRAKNASGEKAKMYHWCANMKSGRKKK